MAATGREEGTFGKLVLSSLQSGTRGRPQIGCGVHVRADGRNKAAPEIGGPAHLLLSAVLGFPGDGTCTRGRAQHCCVEYDPRPGRRGPGIESGGLGEPARYCGITAGYWHGWRSAQNGCWRVLRVLNSSLHEDRPTQPVAHPRIEPLCTSVLRNVLKASARGCHNQLLTERASWPQPH